MISGKHADRSLPCRVNRRALPVYERAKPVQLQSKICQLEALRSALANLLAKLPSALHSDPQVKKLAEVSQRGPLSLVRLVNRHDTRSSDFKDYEFSRTTVNDLWQGGHDDVCRAISHPEACRMTDLGNGVRAYDLQ